MPTLTPAAIGVEIKLDLIDGYRGGRRHRGLVFIVTNARDEERTGWDNWRVRYHCPREA